MPSRGLRTPILAPTATTTSALAVSSKTATPTNVPTVLGRKYTSVSAANTVPSVPPPRKPRMTASAVRCPSLARRDREQDERHGDEEAAQEDDIRDEVVDVGEPGDHRRDKPDRGPDDEHPQP
jgi:hypothetical protein